MCFVTHFLSVCGFYFHFPNSVFSRTELLNCNKIQLIRLFFHRSCFRCFIQKVFESLGSLRFTFMLSYRNFMVLHFAFRSMTHFEFIFVKGMKSVSRFGGCHVIWYQLFQHHLLKILSPLNCLFSFVKEKLAIFVWVYFWAFYSDHWFICLFFHWYHTVLLLWL